MAALTANSATAQKAQKKDQPVAAMVPFIRASSEHEEATGIDVSRVMTTADQDLGVYDIPAFGYIRNLLIYVTVSGGTGGSPAVTAGEDSPWTTLKNIALQEPNGGEIHRFNSGYDMYLANKWGGYRSSIGADFRSAPSYVAVPTTGAAWSFMCRIPVELNGRDALGALANQNAAANYKLKMTLAANTDVGSGTWPTTLPTARVRVYLEAWDQPEIQSAGATNQITPPALGTTQFWTTQIYNYNAGSQTIQLRRVGNFLRNLILIARRTSSTRANGGTDFPDPMTLYLDTRPLKILGKDQFRQYMAERTGYGMSVGTEVPALDAPHGLDAGVFVYDFTHDFDGTLGRENRDLWQPSLTSSRLELQGSFGNAGTLTVLTNDVIPTGPVFL